MSMDATRRGFIGAAVALPAVAVVAPVAQVTTAEAAAPGPYGKYSWQWFVSNDECNYYDSFGTMAEAIEYAKRSDYRYIAECIQQDFDLSVGGWSIIDHLNEANYELVGGDGEGIECTPEQERDLGKMVTAAVEAWAVKHKISLTAYTFGDTRNRMDLEEPHTLTSKEEQS